MRFLKYALVLAGPSQSSQSSVNTDDGERSCYDIYIEGRSNVEQFVRDQEAQTVLMVAQSEDPESAQEMALSFITGMTGRIHTQLEELRAQLEVTPDRCEYELRLVDTFAERQTNRAQELTSAVLTYIASADMMRQTLQLAQYQLETQFNTGSAGRYASTLEAESMDSVRDSLAALKDALGYTGQQIFRDQITSLEQQVQTLLELFGTAKETAETAWEAGAEDRRIHQEQRALEVKKQNEEYFVAQYSDSIRFRGVDAISRLEKAKSPAEVDDIVEDFEYGTDNQLEQFQTQLLAKHEDVDPEDLGEYTLQVSEVVSSNSERVRLAASCVRIILEAHITIVSLIESLVNKEAIGQILLNPSSNLDSFKQGVRSKVRPEEYLRATGQCPREMEGRIQSEIAAIDVDIDERISSTRDSLSADPEFQIEAVKIQGISRLQECQNTDQLRDEAAKVVSRIYEIAADLRAPVGVAEDAAEAVQKTVDHLGESLVSAQEASECHAKLLATIENQKKSLRDSFIADFVTRGKERNRIDAIRTNILRRGDIRKAVEAILAVISGCSPEDRKLADHSGLDLTEFLIQLSEEVKSSGIEDALTN